MLYYNFCFENYEEFKERFSVIEHGNGVKSRKNKIMLALLKHKPFLHVLASRKSYFTKQRMDGYNDKSRTWTHYYRWISYIPDGEFDFERISLHGVPYMRIMLSELLQEMSSTRRYKVRLMDGKYYFRSDLYKTDDMDGLCEDGDSRSVRYINTERDRVFKMRAGKFLRNIIGENPEFSDIVPEQAIIWMCEDFAEEWKAYAADKICSDKYKLHVDDNFEGIYDSSCCAGYDDNSDSFGSCMVDDGFHTFYRDAVEAKAAYLTDRDGMIVARCIIYTDVLDGNGNHLRLAERQYSEGCDLELQRRLIFALINGNYIDGYKRVGASCHDPFDFQKNDGSPLEERHLSISCHLEDGDIVSYQDSFKWFNPSEERAYNYDACGCINEDHLTTTGGVFEYDVHGNEEWSDYNQEYIPSDEAIYIESREDYFWEHQCSRAYIGGDYEYCFDDDILEVDGENYYAGRNCEDPGSYGICVCEECGEYYFGDDGYYSELTDEYYCSKECMDEAEESYKGRYWFYSSYDDEYYKDKDDIVVVFEWVPIAYRYDKATISKETLEELFENGEAVSVGDKIYIDEIGLDGEPAHFAAASFAVA